MKRVSVEIANAIAKAGYWGKYGNRCEVQEIVDSERLLLKADYSLISMRVPTYMDIWLWLWREKKIAITSELWYDFRENWGSIIESPEIYNELSVFDDPEEAIIAAIEYLVTNKLLK